MMRCLKVAIIGFGGIGGVVAGLACRAGHEVSVVLDGPRLRKANDVCTLDSSFYGIVHFRPDFVSRIPDDIDVVVLAVKWQQFDQSWLEFLRDVRSGVVVSLLNGIGFHRHIVRATPVRCCIATIGFIEARKPESGIFKHISNRSPMIQYSSEGIGESDMRTLECFWQSVGFDSVALGSSSEVIWSKLMRLDVIASMTCAYQRSIGYIRENRVLRQEMESLIAEVVSVAGSDGVHKSVPEIISMIDALPFGLTTSLQQDISKGLVSELEVITGGVIARARELRVDVPAHLAILDKILLLQKRITLSEQTGGGCSA